MVGNKAKKAIAAALSGAMVLSAAAPAFAGMWTGTKDQSWYRINGDHKEGYVLGTLNSDQDDMDGTDESQVADSGIYVKGENRYDTMFDAVSYNVSNAPSPWEASKIYNAATKEANIVIASGTSQADSLVAAGLAGNLAKAFNVPVIFTDGNTLSVQAKRAIKYYFDILKKDDKVQDGTLKIHVVGGLAAIDAGVVDDILGIDDDKDENKCEIEVVRYAGEDRTATSLAAFAGEGKFIVEPDDNNNEVFVANGTAWPDALSVSSFAYRDGKPILLTGADGKLTAEQVAFLLDNEDKISISVIGGPALPSVQQLTDEGFNWKKVDYIGGKDRYETSAAVIKDQFDKMKEKAGSQAALKELLKTVSVAAASGSEEHWADALIGGPFVGANNGILALSDENNFVALKEAYKAVSLTGDLTPGMAEANQKKSYIIGGEASLSKHFADVLNKEFPATNV